MRSPYVIPEIISGEVDEDTLGGATHHASRSGVACMVSESESGAFDIAAEILSFLPDHTMAEPPRLSTGDKWKRKCKRKCRKKLHQPYSIIAFLCIRPFDAFLLKFKALLLSFSGFAHDTNDLCKGNTRLPTKYLLGF